MTAGLAQSGNAYLIFHLDGISWESFQRARDAGLVSNIDATFAELGVLRPALSLFPAGTRLIYSRLQSGEANDAPGPLGYASYDRDLNQPIPEVLNLIASLPRRARTATVHGWVAFGAAELAMRNVPALLERYGVVQFFWFATDTIGHLEGEGAMLASLARFDDAFGALSQRLDLERVNLIIYGDHGLSFSEDLVDIERVVWGVVGEEVKYLFAPNLYLHRPETAPQVARALIETGSIDFVAYRSGLQRIEGYLNGEWFELVETDGEIAYRSETDPFDYGPGIPQGVPLSPDAWLRATVTHPYPAAVVNLYRYTVNHHTGDVVFGVNPPRIPPGDFPFVGHHAGLAATDLLVPVLVRGPDLGPLLREDPLWLHTLYSELAVDVFEVRRVREDHQLILWVDPNAPRFVIEARLSPAYRWRVAGELEWGEGVAVGEGAIWAEYDLFSDYLMRTWVGVGANWGDGGISPMMRLASEFDVGDLRFLSHVHYGRGQLTFGLQLRYALADNLSVGLRSSGEVGLGVRW